jgi:hypothetical protein
MNVNNFRKQQKEVLKTLTIMSANRNVEKLTKNEDEGKKQLKKGEQF